jgi:hypothetical protein
MSNDGTTKTPKCRQISECRRRFDTLHRVFTGETPHVLRFYIANMGPDDLVLGYPWFAATNAQPDWATGTLPASVTICMKGAASEKPTHSVQVAGVRTTV